MIWEKYVAHHASAVEAIHDGACAPALVFSVDRFVGETRVPVGGFADRIKGICFTFLCALATNRAFFIDWETPTPLLASFQPQAVDWRPPAALIQRRAAGRLCDWVDIGYTSDVKRAVIFGKLEEDIFGGIDLVTAWHNLYLPECFIPSSYSASLREADLNPWEPIALFHTMFHRLFRFAPTGPAAERFSAFEAFRAAHGAIVGVQFRTGGDGGWQDPVMDENGNVERVIRAAALRSRTFEQSPAFFVTTDSAIARARLVDGLQAHGPVFTFDVDAFHIDRSDWGAAHLADFVPAEFMALGACDAVITGNGGFGQVAAWAAGKTSAHYRHFA